MKTNGNDPASPTEVTYVDGVLCGIQTGNSSGISIGLTKREQFAMAAMQGMYNNGVMTISGSIDRSPDGIAKMAVIAADELIDALNK